MYKKKKNVVKEQNKALNNIRVACIYAVFDFKNHHV